MWPVSRLLTAKRSARLGYAGVIRGTSILKAYGKENR